MDSFIPPMINIKIIWIGWSWINALNLMIKSTLVWFEFIAIDIDTNALENSLARTKINISDNESKTKTKDLLKWTDMLFLVTWFWWNTWSTYLPKIAEISKKLWILTIWIITKPYKKEWEEKDRIYNNSIIWLRNKLDTLITIKNDTVSSTIYFTIIDEIIFQTIEWITDIFIKPNIIAVDFNNIKSLFKNAWKASISIGYGEWKNRVNKVIRSLLDNSLLENSIGKATGILFNVYWWTDSSMSEVEEITKRITKFVDDKINIISGYTLDEYYNNEIRVTLVAINNNLVKLKKNQYWKLIFKTTLLLYFLQNDEIISESRKLNHWIIEGLKWDMIPAKKTLEILKMAVKNKLYDKVISFAEYVEENKFFYLMVDNYFILVWASYQENWNLEMADKYFDYYIEYNKWELLNKNWISWLKFVICSLEGLWLTYINPISK